MVFCSLAVDNRAARCAIALLALALSVPLAAQPDRRGLWVGVLTYDGGDESVRRPRAALGIRPVAALADGVWYFDERDHSEPWSSLEVPPVWEPAARPLPTRWRGWLADGTRGVFAVVGALHPGGLYSRPTVATTLRPRLVGDDASHDDILGVAVAGRARIALFAERHADARTAIPRALRVALRQTEHSAVQDAARRGRRPTDAPSPVPWDRLDAVARGIEMHRVLGRPDGGRIHAVETVVPFDASGPCRRVMAFGMAEVTAAGRATVLAASAACGWPSVLQRPVAALERDGRECWLFERYYEDGIAYLLTPPKPLTDLMEQPTCDIR